MKVVVSGGTGFVGRFVVEDLVRAGHAVRVLARNVPAPGVLPPGVDHIAGTLDPDADQSAAFAGADAFVHAAFDHVPGRYRGGEGDDPNGFRRRNLDGSAALFSDAKRAGVRRVVFLSSRAAYGSQAPGRALDEETVAHPDTLYGQVKFAAERALDALCDDVFDGVSLRVTGVYGPAAPGRRHKWSDLFEDYLAGRPVSPRLGTEVHGEDVAAAVRLMLDADTDRLGARLFNVSDLLLDRHDLLAIVRSATGSVHPLPDPVSSTAANVMTTARLEMLGWRPGGIGRLEATVRDLPEIRPAAAR